MAVNQAVLTSRLDAIAVNVVIVFSGYFVAAVTVQALFDFTDKEIFQEQSGNECSG